ncbi:hypothetical protein JVT61DRAFT_861 [Boletus reticuloceps]|uniref:DNA 3'-5' helicase n=1 Tax=Boletus reticuloceps TaxID=495285 RepID=A0A8I3AE87_9AGAM|nr:hypothetical protein JVT61DRAFT_861 [Boletus reticuloceps]
MTNQQPRSGTLDDPLIYHPFLTRLNLVVNAEFRFLICQLCQEGISVSTAQGHINNKHPELQVAFHQDRFNDATRTVCLASTFPDTILGPRSVVHGLAICEAIACNQCSTVMTSLKKMRHHHIHNHPGLPTPQQFRACRAQRIKTKGLGKQRTLWEIITTAGSAMNSKEVMITTLMAELDKELEVVQIPTDNRLISPWLRTTRWHEHVAATSMSIDNLRAGVALPRPETEEPCCKKLQQLVEQYFQEALELIDTTDELILQRLNSPDPAKNGISNTPFHKHMMDATIKQYINPVICLLAMLLRDLWIGMEQENIVISMLEDLIEQDQEPSYIVQQIHVVLMKLWTTHWRKVSDYPQRITDPTEAALALMTLNQDGSFKEPKNVTNIIAKLEYCMRLTFLKEIRSQAARIDGNTTEVTACDMLQPWFTEKTYSTFARLRSLQHRASAIAYDTMGLPHIWWTDTEAWTSLKYKGNSINFSDLRDMFQDMENDIITIWKDRVLRGLPLRVDYQNLVDDPSNTNVGYSFLFDPKNTCFQDRTRLVRAVVEDQGGFSGFLMQQEQDGRPIWNRAALYGWLQDYAALQKLLLLRAEMLSGAPARGTELTATIYCNTQTRPTRSLMVLGEHVTLLCQYSKTSAMTGQDKVIPHSLDAITSDILIQDLALARPFAQLAAKICFDDQNIDQLYKELLFVNFNRKFTSEDLSAVMAKYSLPRVQYALTISPWRHIQTAWKRKLRCAMEHIIEIDETQNVDALQAGHSRSTENRIYGLSTQSLAGAAEDILPLFLQASISWQEHCRVPSGGHFIPYYKARDSMKAKPLEKMPVTSMHDPSTTCATANNPIIVEDIVARVVERLTPMLADIMQAIKKQDNHQSQAPSFTQPSAKHKGKKRQLDSTISEDGNQVTGNWNEGTEEEDRDLQAAIRASMVSQGVSLQHTLFIHIPIASSAKIGPGESSTSHHQNAPASSVEQQALYKIRELLHQDSLDWTSREQKEAMNATLQGQTDVVAILPTGGGKSMLAIIPSLLEVNKTTVLVLPLNALIMDYERRLQKMHVPYQIYEPSKDLNLRDNLMIVSADKSQSTHWRGALASHAHRKTVARIVVDEAHIPLTAKGYRECLQHFSSVRSEPVQLVLLSATLPPSFMPTLRETYKLVTDTSIHRQGTNRRELKFALEKTAGEGSLIQRAMKIVEEEAHAWQPRDRALVFVPSVRLCMEIAKKTGWHHYVGDKKTMDEGERRMEYFSWISGETSRVMIATSAFSTGNDYPHVRLVLHVDKPFEMLEYIQGQGRAGRDGSPALCYTLVPTKQWKESSKKDPVEKDNEQAIIDHLHLYGSKRCLRYGITSYVDGTGISCLEDVRNQHCSVCTRDPGHRPQDIQMATMPQSKKGAVLQDDSEITTIPSVPTTFSAAAQLAKTLKASRELGSLNEVERLQRAFRSIQHACRICLVHKPDELIGLHDLYCCMTMENNLGVSWNDYKAWRKQLKYGKHHLKICYVCHVPQITDELHPTFTKSKKGGSGLVTCEYADIVAPLAFAIHHNPDMRGRAETYFGTRWPTLMGFTQWLIGIPRKDRQSNMIDLLLWYVEIEKV